MPRGSRRMHHALAFACLLPEVEPIPCVSRRFPDWPGDVLANLPENARFTLESEGGWEGQRTGPRQTVTCASSTDYPASQVHERIPGQAIALNCLEINERGVSVSKLRYAFLRQLGVALLLERTTPRARTTMAIETLQME